MADEGAWNAGWNLGAGYAGERFARKQARADELYETNLRDKYNEISQQLTNAKDNLGTAKAQFGENSQEYKDALETLSRVNQAHNDLLSPQKGPGVLRRLAQRMGVGPREVTPTQAARVQTETAPGLPGATVEVPAAGPGPEVTFPTAVGGGGAFTVKGPAAGPAAKLPPQPKNALNQYANPEDQPAKVSFAFNKGWAKSGPYTSTLSPQEETEFRQWAAANPKSVAGEVGPAPDFAPLPQADYDVRGHFHAAKVGDPAGNLTPNPWDGKIHGNDKFKTPYNGGFSNESMYATPDAPRWVGDKLTTKGGKLVTDETPRTAGTLKKKAQEATGAAAAQPGITVTPQPVQLPAEAGGPIQIGAQPGYQRTELGREAYPGEYAPGTPKELRERAQRRQAAEQESAMQARTAPPSPEQQEIQKAGVATAGEQAGIEGAMRIFDRFKPNATPEERQEHMDLLLDASAGIKAGTLKPLTGSKPYQAADGLWYEDMYDSTTRQNVAVPMPANYKPPAAKPGTGALNVGLDAYAAAHGFASFSDIPDEYRDAVFNYEQRKQALDRVIPRSTTTTKIEKDASGNPIPVTVTNYSGPAGNVELRDPLPIAAGEGGAKAPSGTVQPTPAATKPGGAAKRAAATAPAAGGNVRVGKALPFQMATPASSKAQTNYSAAVQQASLADDAVANPNNSEMQFLLVDSILHGTLGRVNEIEIKRIQDRGGWALAPERWEEEARAGTMAPELVKQLQDFTKSQIKATQKAMNALSGPSAAPSGGGGAGGGGGGAAGAGAAGGGVKPKHSLAKAIKLPFNKGKTEAAVRADLEAHGYEVIP